MADDVIRVGIVGAGTNTRKKHIPGFQAIEGVELAAVCNRTRESGQRVADAYGIERVYTSWRELVAAPDVHAVCIGAWPYLHCRVTLAALAEEKHVLCEARMARDASEARRMLDAAQAKPHLVAQVVPSPFTLSVDATIKRLIAEGYLGDVVSVEVRSCGAGYIDRDAPLHWRQDFELSGYNILDLGIRYEAVLRWVGEATRVMAMGKTFVPMRADASGMRRAVRIPDHLEVVAEMACGALAHFQHSAVAGVGAGNDMTLYGTEGTLRFADGALWGARRGDNDLSAVAISPDDLGAWRVEEEFASAIRGTETVTHTTFEDGLRYMEFVEAVSRSMLGRRTVALPL